MRSKNSKHIPFINKFDFQELDGEKKKKFLETFLKAYLERRHRSVIFCSFRVLIFRDREKGDQSTVAEGLNVGKAAVFDLVFEIRIPNYITTPILKFYLRVE